MRWEVREEVILSETKEGEQREEEVLFFASFLLFHFRFHSV